MVRVRAERALGSGADTGLGRVLTAVVVQTRSTEYDSIKNEFERTALDRATVIETRVDTYALCRSLLRWQCFDIAIHRGVCVACMRCSAGANDVVIG
jgi:hypothetical protein